MASTGTVTIAATVSGLPTGSKAFSFAYGPLTGAVAEILDQALSSGNNTITVPTGATWLFIQPPSSNTVQMYLKTTPADVGLQLDLTRMTPYPIPAGVTSLTINAAAPVTPEISFI